MSQPEMKTLPDGSKEWRLDGKLHREDGPAVERPNGTKQWRIRGKLHREDGPAIEWSDGTKEWWLDGKLHREDGPAIEWADGTKQWWLGGENVPWQQVYHAAKTDEALVNILFHALTAS